MPSGQPSPGPGDRDIDAAFEDIVARWGEAPVEPVRPRAAEARRPDPSGPLAGAHHAPSDAAPERSPAPPAEPRTPALPGSEPTAGPSAGPQPAAARGLSTDPFVQGRRAVPAGPAPQAPGHDDAGDAGQHRHHRVPDTPPAGVRQASGIVVPDVPAQGQRQEHFGHRGYTPAETPEESYVPPPPAPMPAPESDPVFWAIIGCLAGGPLLLVLLVLTGRTSMTLLMGLGVLATCVGFVLLVLRGGRQPRDPSDDGARL